MFDNGNSLNKQYKGKIIQKLFLFSRIIHNLHRGGRSSAAMEAMKQM